jgi:hypothetical protein
MSYKLEKWIWTEADFGQMGWHDATIYAIQFGKDISFDIDYIFEWVQADKEDFFSFIVAPATLSFLEPDATQFSVDFRFGQYLEIEEIHRRAAADGNTEWYIETHQGDITIQANQFRQVIRRLPTRQTGQQLLPEERGGTSFSSIPDVDYAEPEGIAQIKAADFALRDKAVQLRRLSRQIDILREQRSAGTLEVKQFILEKRDLESKMAALRGELSDTDWQ